MESLSKSDSKLNQSVFAASVKNAEVEIWNDCWQEIIVIIYQDKKIYPKPTN